jgi:hypothetical protein
MPLIIDFKNDPLGFLADNIVVVGMQKEEESAPIKPKRFELVRRHQDSNVVELRFRLVGNDNNSLLAYWLPWCNNKAVTLTLGGAATFMFTTEMTNCRFSVLTADEAAPTVAHVAGTGSASKQRDGLEVKAGLPKRGEEGDRRMRRMSRSDLDLHAYRGNKGDDSSSAFVFGQYSGNRWRFYGQVVAGIMDGDTIDKGTYPKQAQQLGGPYTIDA